VFVTERRDQEGKSRKVHVPEHLDVVADMAGGGQANIQISAVTGHDDPPGIWLFGEEGTLRFSSGKLYRGARDGAGLEPIEIPPHESVGWRVEAEFIGAIRGEEQVRRTTFADGVRYMEFTEAVQRSLQSGRMEAVAS
jgi:predicted dehydrogenase